MEVWLRPFIFGLAALFGLPFVLTQLLFCSTRYESEKQELKRKRIPGTLLNLAGNLAACYGFSALFFHTRYPWNPLKQILAMQCSWQDLAALSLTVAACTAAALAGGFLLRRLLLRQQSSVSGGIRAIVFALCLVCAAMTFAACSVSRQSVRLLQISEVCRKTTVFAFDPEGKEKLGAGNREVSYVLVRNDSPLDISVPFLYLSETEDELTALPFAGIIVPAGGTSRLTRDYEHGLDLKKNGGSTVFLSRSGDTVIDRLKIPALAEDEVYSILSPDGKGEVRPLVKHPVYTLEAPVFSVESGFYADGFDLSLSGPDGTEIYYTLDAGDPLSGGTLYTGPLRIEDPSPAENVWSARTDVSASFTTDTPRYTVPDEPVDKCMVVRAVCVDTEGQSSPVITKSYFIGYEKREGYDGIGIISLVTEPENLFSYEKGIYVIGRTAEEKRDTPEAKKNWWWWPANYHEKGRLWEREASVAFFDPERNLQLNGPAGMRIKGGASSGMLPKGLNLYARKDYGMPLFDADLFGSGYIAKRISLSAGGNDVNLKIRDWLTARLAGNLGLTMNRFVPYCLFLDGEYWGNYWLTEQYDDVYFTYTYRLTNSNVVVFKTGSLKAGVNADKELYNQLVGFFRTEDLSRPENYETACNLVDMEDFTRYYALQMYIANQDRGLKKNTAFWRARTEENVPGGDTRWRFALFDVNYHTCYNSADSDTLSYMRQNDEVFDSLMNSSAFRDGFYAALRMLATDVFTPEKGEEALSEYASLMEQPLELEHRRFNRRLTGLGELDEIRTFFRERQTYILDLCTGYEASRQETGKE